MTDRIQVGERYEKRFASTSFLKQMTVLTELSLFDSYHLLERFEFVLFEITRIFGMFVKS